MIAYNFNLYERDFSSIFNIGVIILLFIDIVLNFKTGFVEKGEIIMDSSKIMLNYYNKKLKFDILNPISLIIGII